MKLILKKKIYLYVKKTNFLKCVRCWQFEEDVKRRRTLFKMQKNIRNNE